MSTTHDNSVALSRRGSATVTLPSDTEIVITRTFAAPAHLVFRAWTTPEHVRRWWSGEAAPLIVCDIDLRVGGSWRYVTRDADGVELGWHGTYREIAAPHRLVSTEVFEGYPDGEAVNTLTLTEVGGMTVLTATVLHSSRENRDGHVNSGMESGMQIALDRVDDILVEMLADESSQSPTVADRYHNVAGKFTATVMAVPADAWDQPAPCAGWVARDVVRHLVEWFPPFLRDGAGVELPAGPSVDDDPVRAWTVMNDAVVDLLDDPLTASRTFAHDQAGTHSLDEAIGMFFLGDVLIHTWDLARATGGDESLDPVEVRAMLIGMEPMDDMLRTSGHYGPRVPVPDTADDQTKLIAFTGRHP